MHTQGTASRGIALLWISSSNGLKETSPCGQHLPTAQQRALCIPVLPSPPHDFLPCEPEGAASVRHSAFTIALTAVVHCTHPTACYLTNTVLSSEISSNFSVQERTISFMPDTTQHLHIPSEVNWISKRVQNSFDSHPENALYLSGPLCLSY